MTTPARELGEIDRILENLDAKGLRVHGAALGIYRSILAQHVGRDHLPGDPVATRRQAAAAFPHFGTQPE